MFRVLFGGEIYLVMKIYETTYYTDLGNITMLTYGISLEESANQKSDFHTYVHAYECTALPSTMSQIHSEWTRGMANASI